MYIYKDMEKFWQSVQLNWWAPSKRLAAFWIGLIAGVVIAQYISLPRETLYWVLGLWLLVFWSGQEPKIEAAAVLIFGVSSGMLLWDLTGGQPWLNLQFISALSDKLVLLRNNLIDKIIAAVPEPQSSLLSGILLGNRIKLDKELVEQFRLVGLSHIIAVSGYNLTILVANVRSIFRPIFGRNAFWLGLAVIGLFIIITGAPPSILRAGLMIGLILLGEYLGRPTNPLLILLTAAGLLTLFEPKIILDVGFQLSVAATYGLMRVSPIIRNGLQKLKIPTTLATILGETIGAVLLTSPIILLVFERLSIVSPLTNVLVVPLIPLVMAIGLIGSVLVFFVPALGNWLLMLGWPILTWTLLVSRRFSSFDFASYSISVPWLWCVLILLFFVVLAEYIQIRYKPNGK
jgi:competence protein ComEC